MIKVIDECFLKQKTNFACGEEEGHGNGVRGGFGERCLTGVDHRWTGALNKDSEK